MYATVPEIRGEGVTEAQASEERLLVLIDEATGLIDRSTGWFFKPQLRTFVMDGRGVPTVEPPAPPIRLDRVLIGGAAISLSPDELVVVGAPTSSRFNSPRLTRRYGRRFPKGDGNVEVEGLWGYTEDDGSEHGRTPLAIRRACMMLVLRTLPPIGDVDAAGDARNRWRILEERTRDQSFKLNRDQRSTELTGDPDVDAILVRYRRPKPLGAA